MTSFHPPVRNMVLIAVVALILVAGIIFFTGKPPVPAPSQSPPAGTCCPVGGYESGNSTPPTKVNLTPAQEKISTDLLQLEGVRDLPMGVTQADLERQMEQNHQLTRVAGTGETLVYVYIQMNDRAGTTSLDIPVWNETNSDPASHLVVAWVDATKLENLASLESVRSIRTVTPPVTGRG